MKDNFSNRSADYSRYRPRYPEQLFEFIAGTVPSKKLAWDAGTGNGQTAVELANYFESVYATDISQNQLNNATQLQHITYALEPAEKTKLKNMSVNLITVSQALHWFQFDEFYREVRRVAARDAIFAAWSYSLLQVDPDVDKMLTHFHFETLKDHWDEERKYVNDGYASIPFPFETIPTPGFTMEARWNLQELEGYLSTWSAVEKFIRSHRQSPLPELIKEISKHWEPGETKLVYFPLHLKIGRVH